MSKYFFEKKEVHKKLWKLLFHDCYQVNLNSPSYNLSSDITHVFSPFVVPGTCLGPWTKIGGGNKTGPDRIGWDRIDKTRTGSDRINKTWIGLRPIDKTRTRSEKKSDRHKFPTKIVTWYLNRSGERSIWRGVNCRNGSDTFNYENDEGENVVLNDDSVYLRNFHLCFITYRSNRT